MKYTNQYNLPEPIFNVICNDSYVHGDGDYSVTQVINSPRIVQLSRYYKDDLSEDAMERIWSVFGSAVHHLMETHASEDGFVEKRYYVECLGRKIGGQVDAYNNKCITDYKVTSVYSIMGNKREDWERQQNLYAHILRQNGIPVEKIQIAVFLRDWSKGMSQRGGNYPQQPFMIVPLRMWPDEEVKEYLEFCVQRLIDNESCADNPLYQCSSEEMWEKPAKYAVTKVGATKATKLCDSIEEAQEYISTAKGDFNIIVRRGERTRCKDYCSVSGVCSIYKEYTKDGN